MRSAKEFMKASDVAETVTEMRAESSKRWWRRRIPEGVCRAVAIEGAGGGRSARAEPDAANRRVGREEGIDERGLRDRVEQAADASMAARRQHGPSMMRSSRSRCCCRCWMQWEGTPVPLDHLRQGIGLARLRSTRSAERVQSEAFALFTRMLDELKERVTMSWRE